MATTTTTARRIAVRPMTIADLRQVRRIERAAYGPNVPGTPFERELQNGLAQYLVAVERSAEASTRQPGVLDTVRRLLHLQPQAESILGFVGLWYTIDQLHIVTIAVDPALQHRGIAQRLLIEVHTLAVEAEMKTIALEVRPSNERARALYEWFGFQPQGTLRAYYSDNGEDAVVMLTPELTAPDYAAHLRALRTEHAARGAETFEAPREPDPDR
jgi:ribosomal-protein-alanine N-acetyltransferase